MKNFLVISVLILSVIGVSALVVFLAVRNNTKIPAISGPISTTTTDASPTALPLGDNKYSTSPKKGYIYLCNTNLNGGGAFRVGEWIDEINKVFDITKKPTVDGDINWPQATVTITIEGTNRVIKSNALPTNHNTGEYPVKSTDDAYNYDRNPNSIKEQTISYTFPANPTVLNTPNCIGGEVGIALNGVPIFNGFDAGGRDAVAHEIQDECYGHPQIAGEYHYHNLSNCLNSEKDSAGNAKLIGYAFDGFGIFGPEESDKELMTDDLDECHGHLGNVLWDGKIVSMYHYHATKDFPYTVSCYRGQAIQINNPESRPNGRK